MADIDLDEELRRLERIIGSFENDPDVAVRERVTELLEQIDVVHRELVWKVGQSVHAADPSLFESLLADPVTSVLFEMYGLVAASGSGKETASDEPTAVFGLDALLASIPAPFSWFEVARLDEVGPATLLARDVAGERVLVVHVADGVRAYVDQCPGSPLTLNAGVVRDGALLCPWHDCRYDLATGRRLDRDAPGLAALQCEVSGDRVRVGMRPKRQPVS